MTETLQSLGVQEVDKMVRDWYRALDVHAPVEELLPMLASEGLEMVFPEATLHGIEEFKGWYHTVTNRFFDEVHEMKKLDVRPAGELADVSLVVNWQAKVWDPPAAKSRWLGFDAAQTWVVSRSAAGAPVISKYVVDGLTPMEGSSSL